MAQIRKILVATDFSEDAEQALELALDLGRTYGAKVTLLHVCQLPAYAFFTGGLYAPTPELVGDVIRDADAQLRAVAERLAARGLSVEPVRLTGEPAELVPQYADDHEFDLIVMGTHGRRGLKRMVMGSVAEHVVRVAEMPVLTVRAQAPLATSAGAS
jgi:nucleotide-binding universal stress UspA family protein